VNPGDPVPNEVDLENSHLLTKGVKLSGHAKDDVRKDSDNVRTLVVVIAPRNRIEVSVPIPKIIFESIKIVAAEVTLLFASFVVETVLYHLEYLTEFEVVPGQ